MKSSKEDWYPFNKYLIGEPERARLPIFKYYIKEPKDRLDPHAQSIKFTENFKCFHHFSSNEKVTHCYMLFHYRFQMFCKPLGSFINISHLIVFSSCYWSTPHPSDAQHLFSLLRVQTLEYNVYFVIILTIFMCFY